ncbi:MAG TPA: hypothetical protein VNT75_10600 [Symbiobacteriaceae bacterium]|nr:hypothetical protein [Symbiobacteriaceae bacterium]
MDRPPSTNTPQAVFSDPIVQLAALCPLCALAALSPAAALAALSPVLRLFNPAINPAAALLSFAQANGQTAVTSRVAARVGTRLTGLMTKVQRLQSIGS